MKRFVTIFQKLENVHLVKDVGMIPYILYKDFGYESTIISFKNGGYPYLNSEVRGLKQEFLAGNARYKKLYGNFLTLLYLLRKSKEIDILNLYHFQLNNLIFMNVYKKLNPKGIGFLKFDSLYRMNSKDSKYVNSLTGRRFGRIRWEIKKKLCKNIDIMSAESHDGCRDISKILEREIIYIPNGYVDVNGISGNHKDSKENIFLTVGRLGTPPKNTDLLLDAFMRIYKECDWNLILIGTIEKNTEIKLDSIYKKNNNLKGRIIYVGEIFDRELLFSYYKRAKVFLMPSRWENFSLATVEALSQGCYVILSDGVAPWKEFTDNGNTGAVVQKNSIEQLSAAMLRVTDKDLNPDLITEYAKQNFYWPSICEKIDEILLNEKRKQK